MLVVVMPCGWSYNDRGKGPFVPPSLLRSRSTSSHPPHRHAAPLSSSLGLVLAASIRETSGVRRRVSVARPPPAVCPSLSIALAARSFCASLTARSSSVFRCVGCSRGLCCRYRDTDPYPKPRPRAARFYVCRRELMHR